MSESKHCLRDWVPHIRLTQIDSRADQHESFVDRLFHHKHDQSNKHSGDGCKGSESSQKSTKESAVQNLEDYLRKDKQEASDYLKEDEKLEKEGDTYGGLM